MAEGRIALFKVTVRSWGLNQVVSSTFSSLTQPGLQPRASLSSGLTSQTFHILTSTSHPHPQHNIHTSRFSLPSQFFLHRSPVLNSSLYPSYSFRPQTSDSSLSFGIPTTTKIMQKPADSHTTATLLHLLTGLLG